MNTDYPKVTRIEVIGGERDFVKYGCEDVQVSLQDDGQTLKVFYDWDSEDEASMSPTTPTQENS